MHDKQQAIVRLRIRYGIDASVCILSLVTNHFIGILVKSMHFFRLYTAIEKYFIPFRVIILIFLILKQNADQVLHHTRHLLSRSNIVTFQNAIC